MNSVDDFREILRGAEDDLQDAWNQLRDAQANARYWQERVYQQQLAVQSVRQTLTRLEAQRG